MNKWGIKLITKLQDLFILLLNPWIPIVGRIKDKVRYRLITLCFVIDLVLFCIVRYGLHKESYFYNTVCGIFVMFAIAILSLDRTLVHIHWRRSLWIAWFGMCISFTVSDILVPKKMCGLGLIYRCIFCVAESYEKRFVVAVLQECHKMVVCRYVGDFLFVPSSV